MSRLIALAEIAQTLERAISSLDMAGLPLTAALIDLAVNQVEQEIANLDAFPSDLAPFHDGRFEILDDCALRIFPS